MHSASLQSRRKASILILTLWTLCFLSVFSLVLGARVRQKLVLVQRLADRDRGRLACESAIKKAIAVLGRSGAQGGQALKDAWSNNPALFRGIIIGDVTVNICYNYFDDARGTVETRWGIVDEERKININKAGAPELARIFMLEGKLDESDAEAVAYAIVDWRDGDSVSASPSGGAEDAHYRGLPYPYEAKDADFQVLEELLLVRGVSDCVFERVRDYLTPYGEGRVNINTAPKSVLLALGVQEEMVKRILEYRRGEDKIEATPDDNVFASSSEIIPRLSEAYSLSESEVAALSAIVNEHLCADSSHFMVRSTASSGSTKDIMTAVCVVKADGTVLSWREP